VATGVNTAAMANAATTLAAAGNALTLPNAKVV